MLLDLDDPRHRWVARRFRTDITGWLTTVSPGGQPHTSVIWFLWRDDDSFLLYSRDNQKIRNLAGNPKVSLHLEGDGRGGDIVVVEGTAAITPDEPPAHQVPAYLAKYAERIALNGWSPESFADDYSVPVVVTPVRLRGH